MMEPVRTNPPPEGYLEEVQRLAKANDAILIFDEVSCGWRIAIGGAQEYLGITPDMTVVAKCISNGYPWARWSARVRRWRPARMRSYPVRTGRTTSG